MTVVNRAVYAWVMGTILIGCYLRRRMNISHYAKEKTMAYAAKFQLETVRKLNIAYRGSYPGERAKLEKRLELIIGILEREQKYRTPKEINILAETERVHWNGKIFNFHHYGMGGRFGEGKIPPIEDTEEDIEDW
tara:strand:- start:325 stop:729 length:405 start_codon:yes stop_codon:yes gene_type:complete